MYCDPDVGQIFIVISFIINGSKLFSSFISKDSCLNLEMKGDSSQMGTWSYRCKKGPLQGKQYLETLLGLKFLQMNEGCYLFRNIRLKA